MLIVDQELFSCCQWPSLRYQSVALRGTIELLDTQHNTVGNRCHWLNWQSSRRIILSITRSYAKNYPKEYLGENGSIWMEFWGDYSNAWKEHCIFVDSTIVALFTSSSSPTGIILHWTNLGMFLCKCNEGIYATKYVRLTKIIWYKKRTQHIQMFVQVCAPFVLCDVLDPDEYLLFRQV